jgi:uncharacterized protein (DUF4415 family)
MGKDKIKYGKVHIPAEEFHPSKEKVKISMWVDGDVLDAFKLSASKENKGYQTLMNEKLREAMESLNRPPIESRVENLENAIQLLLKAKGK